MELDINDLAKVRNFLYEVRLKWYDIGLELEMKVDELDEIKTTKNDSSVCLREMLKVRLKYYKNPLTWKAIAEALERDVIGELKLASQGNHLPMWGGGGGSSNREYLVPLSPVVPHF